MIISSNVNTPDDVSFGVTYCETGSRLEFKDSVGNSFLTLSCIPPAILVRLRDALSEEIDKGPLTHPLGKGRKPR